MDDRSDQSHPKSDPGSPLQKLLDAFSDSQNQRMYRPARRLASRTGVPKPTSALVADCSEAPPPPCGGREHRVCSFIGLVPWLPGLVPKPVVKKSNLAV